MRERSERGESPGTYVTVTERVYRGYFCLALCSFGPPSPVLWWLSHGERSDAVT